MEKIERKRDRERWRETENDGWREKERISVTLPPAGIAQGQPYPEVHNETTHTPRTHTHLGHDGLTGRLNVSINPNILLLSTRRTIAKCLPTRARLSAWCLRIVFKNQVQLPISKFSIHAIRHKYNNNMHDVVFTQTRTH